MSASNERLVRLYERVARSRKPSARERLSAIYARHGLSPEDGPVELVDEIGRDGGNSIASLFRGGRGVEYAEVVADVADRLDVAFEDDLLDDEVALEQRCLVTVVASQLEELASTDLAGTVGLLHSDALSREKLDEVARLLGERERLIEILEQVGPKVVAAVVANIAVRQGVARTVSLTGYAVPLLNVAIGVWTLVDLAGPAFRKTVPTVLENAALRAELDPSVR